MQRPNLTTSAKLAATGNGVAVANGCQRFSMYQTALAYQQAGLLKRLLAGWYIKSAGAEKFWQRPLISKLLGQRWPRGLLARRQAGLDPGRVVSLNLPELLELAGRGGAGRFFTDGFFDHWSMRAFGTLTQKYVRDVSLFHVRSGYGGRAMAEAKRHGAVCLVDHSIADPLEIEQTLEEEAARWGLSWKFPGLFWACVCQDLDEADHILANSDYVRETLMARRNLSGDRITVLPFSVDLERFCPAPDVREQAGPFRLLFVGEVGLRKGALYLLRAFKKLGLRDAELVMIGQVTEIESLVAASGVIFRHIPLLPQSELVAHYREAAALVFPSLIEGSARVIQEALACGLPVITTPNAGSVVRDGEEGFVVPIRDEEALALRILELYRRPDLRQEMSLKARAAAERHFQFAAYRAGLVELYNSLVAG
jgi:glycosyltransferase involved in cell wall biosynthesis